MSRSVFVSAATGPSPCDFKSNCSRLANISRLKDQRRRRAAGVVGQVNLTGVSPARADENFGFPMQRASGCGQLFAVIDLNRRSATRRRVEINAVQADMLDVSRLWGQRFTFDITACNVKCEALTP